VKGNIVAIAEQIVCMPAAKKRGCTARMEALAEAAVHQIYARYGEQARLAEEAIVPAEGNAFGRSAAYFAHIYPHMTPVIREGELIVGARRRDPEGEHLIGWIPDGTASYVERFAGNVDPQRPDLHAMAARGLISPQGSFNHKVVDYAGYVRTGSRALAEQARRVAEEREGEERQFALDFARGHEAIIAQAQTYAEACRELAGRLKRGPSASRLKRGPSAEAERAAELLEIARICEKVPAEPAETFHEAVQALWFGYMVANDGVGRPDVYLWEFYERDMAAGRLTQERAQELIECLLIKLHADVSESVCNVSSVQTMTLGGVHEDGSDATNNLTRLFLQAIRSVRMLRPTVYVRVHEQTPQDVLELAVEMLGEGLAEPNFFGDAPVLEGLQRLGISLQEARNYALSGCAEVVSPGLGNWGAPNGWLNFALLADEALRAAAEAGVSEESQLWEMIGWHIEALAQACRDCNAYCDEQRVEPNYAQSLLMPVCLERCRDIAHGGLRSHYGHWEGQGLPNAADMIFAALVLALDEGRPLAELLRRLDEGDEAFTMRLRQLPKFGQGHAPVDAVGARLVSMMSEALERQRTPLREALVLGHLAGGENMHIAYGLVMGPTLDGRRAGETLADSLAGSQGVTGSPTAVVRSLCSLDHSRLIAGNVSTLRLLPADFKDEEARRKVVSLVRTFVAEGGSQLQINVLDAETLRRAQECPQEYRGLMVRVAGYSADFTHCGKTLQDEIISRAAGPPPGPLPTGEGGKGNGAKEE
jgi:formate C-acetyltransferase